MNIALYIEQPFDPDAGGVQRSTSKLAKIFKDKGHEVIILSTSTKPTSFESWNKISIYSINLKNTNNKDFKKIIKDEKISILINQAGYSLRHTKFLKTNLNGKVKIINTLRINPLNFYDNHKFMISNFLNNKKLSFLNISLVHRIILKYHIFKQRKELNYIVKNTNAFVMLSERFKQELYFLAPRLKKYDQKIYGIGNPFERPEIDIKNVKKENIILFVGRLNILQKRVDLLVKIWKRLHNEFHDWKFLVVGDGESRIYMESFCKENNLDRIIFFGKDNPNRFYEIAKILHMTSAFEGFGNVLVEAQSYGCVPVLFNSYAAAQDIVKHNENGVLVSPFNIDDYVNQTSILINSPNKLNQLSHNAFESVLVFSYDKSYEKWKAVFQEITK